MRTLFFQNPVRILTCLMILIAGMSFGQVEKAINYSFSEIPKSTVSAAGSIQIEATSAKYFLIDVNTLREQMQGVAHRDDLTNGFIANLVLPQPDGSVKHYRATENTTMARGLAELFPEIRAYDAAGIDDGAFVKWDITPKGLHAMIMIPGESTIYIDPAINGNTDYYIVYKRKDFIPNKFFECTFNGDTTTDTGNAPQGTQKMFGTCELRTYRLALSATGEYTTFHGGTVALAQAAQVTSMNRVNGLYEKDMAITMTIIANNNLIVYTNSTTDPFTNGTPGTMINQNQTNTDAVIGSANYDIGHVFGTNSGGLAGLGVVCAGGNKARGVTGSAAPIGDPFDIDYVAHEMGHQFGGNHTQNNNCNRNALTAVEPGSASTIMGYAGICAPDVQSNSDDHFSGKTLQEIDFEILSAGHTCEMTSALANSAPIIIGTVGNVTVPANTPFALTCNATDANGDPLTYNWEQMDNEVSTQPPVATSTGGPNFRSNPSSSSPTRYFPSLASLATNGPYTWEVVPSVSRIMDFRVTVRDNAPGPGSCNDHADIQVTTDAGSGPFIVLYPSATGISWGGGSSQTVTWDVANTSNAPVACANVDILLSTDGGLTYPTVLASNVPNDGSQIITVPNTPSTTCRVMVVCSSGTFFDISNNNFTITAATYDYSMAVAPSTISVCQPNNAVYTVTIGSFNGYVDPVTLSVSGVPAGATSNFSVNPVTPAGTSTLTISNTGSAIPGTYTLTVTGNSTSGIKTSTLTLTILDGTPNVVTLTAPANGAANVNTPTVFTWSTYTEPGATYDIQIATDAGFTTIVDQASALASVTYSSSILALNTVYYWRVRVNSTCGSSAFTSPFNFTTSGCVTYVASIGLPAAIPTLGTVTRTIVVPTGGTINDVNVLNMVGTHTRMGDLSFTLTSPLGTVVSLMANVCGVNDNFDLDFDDAAASAVIPCPPTTGLSYQPVGLLSDFNGQNSAGTWTLTIVDGQNSQSGSLTGWSLEICVDPPVGCTDPSVPTLSFSPATVCAGSATTLTITGTLNDATNWSVYSGSCGGTLVGTTAGSTFSIPSASNQTYYVRGEDGAGCVDETLLTCATITLATTPVPTAPVVTVTNNCGSSVISATGSGLVWSTGATTSSITVSSAGTYTVTQTVGGCTSTSASGVAAPLLVPSAPGVSGVDGCGSSVLTASGTGLLWSTGATTSSITVTTAGPYTVTQTVGGCTSSPATVAANPIAIPSAPVVTVSDNCGNSVLTATGSGLLWSTGATTSSITVSAAGTYTVSQTIGGCTSILSSGVANPLTVPVISLGTVTDPTTCGASDGSIVVNGSGAGNISWTGQSTGNAAGVTLPYTISGLAVGTYTVGFTNGCPAATINATLNNAATPAIPTVTATDGCGSSILSATGTGLLWSTGETTSSITVTSAGAYTVTQTIAGCTSLPATVSANPIAIPLAPTVSAVDGCGSSVLSATGSGLLWSTGATTSSITVTAPGAYTVTQTIAGCTSSPSTISANPGVIPSSPVVSATDGCGSSVLSATGTGLLWSTGESTSSITVTVAGAYTVSQTIAGCTSSPATVSANPIAIPSSPTVSGVDGCGSSVLSATGTGLLWSTGATTSSITVSTAGAYTVTQTIGGCTSSPSTVAAIPFSSLPAPTASVVNNCGSSTLSVVSSGSILWSTGETTQSIIVTTTGSYTVTETVGGCTSLPATVAASPAAIPATPLVTVVDKCGMSDLSTTAAGVLTWSTSESTPMITVTAAGTYYVSQTVGGCTSAVGIGVANPLTIPGVTFAPLNDVCINTPAFTLSGGTPSGGVYTGTGVSSNVFDPSVAGYGVFTIVYSYTDVNGCSASNQQPITVGCAGVDEIESASFNVYPNPTNGQLTIEIQGMIPEDMNVYDAAGKLVYNRLPVSENGIYVIDLSDLSKGVYSLEVISAVKTFRQRVILTK